MLLQTLYSGFYSLIVLWFKVSICLLQCLVSMQKKLDFRLLAIKLKSGWRNSCFQDQGMHTLFSPRGRQHSLFSGSRFVSSWNSSSVISIPMFSKNESRLSISTLPSELGTGSKTRTILTGLFSYVVLVYLIFNDAHPFYYN